MKAIAEARRRDHFVPDVEHPIWNKLETRLLAFDGAYNWRWLLIASEHRLFRLLSDRAPWMQTFS